MFLPRFSSIVLRFLHGIRECQGFNLYCEDLYLVNLAYVTGFYNRSLNSFSDPYYSIEVQKKMRVHRDKDALDKT
jgi:hypothetical protein